MNKKDSVSAKRPGFSGETNRHRLRRTLRKLLASVRDGRTHSREQRS